MKRKLNGLDWALLGLMLLVVFYTGFMVMWSLRHVGDGCGTYTTAYGLMVNETSAACPLRKGDVITEVNGQRLVELWRSPQAAQRLYQNASSLARYTLLRDGQTIEVGVPWRYPSLESILVRAGAFLVVGLSCLLSATFIILSRSREAGVRVLTLTFGMLGLNILNSIWGVMGIPYVVATSWFYDPLDQISFAFESAFILHALLVFPETKWVVKRYPRSVMLLYGVNLLILAVMLGPFHTASGLTLRATAYSRVYYPVSLVEFGLALGHLVHTYITSRRPGVRNQIRWFMWGVLFGALPWLLLYNIPVTVIGRPLIPMSWALLPTLLVPVSFFFSATRRGLMEVDAVIRRSIVYLLLSGSLIGLYLLLVAFWGQALATFASLTPQLPGMLALLMIIFIGAPLRDHIQQGVDQLFFRRTLDFKATLHTLSEQLATALTPEALITFLEITTPQRLQTEKALLLLTDDAGNLYSLDRDLCIPHTSPLAHYIQRQDVPLLLSQLAPTRLAPFTENLPEATWEILIPLRAGGRNVGVYALATRHSGDLYTREEVETLRVLGRQIAATVENVRLYEQIQAYNRDLEAQIAERTRALALANQTLSRERDQLNVILDHMADALLVTDAQGVIQLTNPVLRAMLNHPTDLTGRPLTDVVACPGLVEAIAQARLQPGEPTSVRCLLRPDVTVQASCVALADDAGVVTVLRDITREVEIDRIKTDFIATASHELRTPLTAILGFARLVSKNFARALQAHAENDARAPAQVQRIQENLDIIIQESERLARLINDMLDIAKMEAGRIEWRNETCALCDLINAAINSLSSLAHAKGLTLITEVAPALPPLACDPDRIQQVLVNLLSNAIKFTPQGTIQLQARLVESEEEIPDWSKPDGTQGVLLVSVLDEGLGLPPQAMSRLFQRFQQLHLNGLTDKPAGTGLGLAISREIIQHYQGHIWAENRPEGGAKFSFVLPIL